MLAFSFRATTKAIWEIRGRRQMSTVYNKRKRVKPKAAVDLDDS